MLDYKIKVPFFDASLQYNAHKTALDKAMQKVLSEGAYINGPEVGIFADNLADYLSINHVIPCGNGTDALCLALMALDLNKGDEVIIPAFNFIAAAEAVALLGLVPVFADVEADSFNVSSASIAKSITPKTKAIIVVHLFGAAVEMDPIIALAKKNNLFVIEDVAQAFGGSYRGEKLGTIGHIGCTSFFPTKNLACFGDGGAVFTNDVHLAAKVKMLANHGQAKKYEHKYLGVNSRLDTIQAAVLNVQLFYLDSYIEKRKDIANYYLQNLKDIKSISFQKNEDGHTYNQFCMLLATEELRNKLKHYLKNNGVDTMIYYPIPTHLQEVFFNLNEGSFPISEELCTRILALPIFPTLEKSSQRYILNLIRDFFEYPN